MPSRARVDSILGALAVGGYSCVGEEYRCSSSAGSGEADMRYRRARYRILAVVMLTGGLLSMAAGASREAIVIQMALAIICAVIGILVRDY